MGLKGLQGVTSHTRAAAGFERPERRGGSPTPTQGKATTATMEDETEEEDDDLDVPSRAPAVTSKPSMTKASRASSPPPRQILKPKPPSSVQPPPKRPLLDTTPSRSSASSKPSSKPQKSPDLPSVDSSPETRRSSLDGDEIRALRRRIQARKTRAEREGKKSIGADEIPIFLV